MSPIVDWTRNPIRTAPQGRSIACVIGLCLLTGIIFATRQAMADAGMNPHEQLVPTILIAQTNGDHDPAASIWHELLARVDPVCRYVPRWYSETRPEERVCWAGMGACLLLGVYTFFGCLLRNRTGSVIPPSYQHRFHARLLDGRIDWNQGLDYCELNPSPASRVALAALRRCGRPASDIERAVTLALQVEVARLRNGVTTLLRLGALAPLIGMLGLLGSTGRLLSTSPPGVGWGPIVAAALVPLSSSVALAILALVSYDGLSSRVETLAGRLERIGTETIDVLSVASVPNAARPIPWHRSESQPPAPHGSAGRQVTRDREANA